jgi:hypothetical protein
VFHSQTVGSHNRAPEREEPPCGWAALCGRLWLGSHLYAAMRRLLLSIARTDRGASPARTDSHAVITRRVMTASALLGYLWTDDEQPLSELPPGRPVMLSGDAIQALFNILWTAYTRLELAGTDGRIIPVAESAAALRHLAGEHDRLQAGMHELLSQLDGSRASLMATLAT